MRQHLKQNRAHDRNKKQVMSGMPITLDNAFPAFPMVSDVRACPIM
jgi:hypothetical protein